MGSVNFVIIKDLKLVVVAPREIRPEEGLQQYVEKVLDGKVIDASESDLMLLKPYMFEDKPCTGITVVELATLIKVFDSFMALREVSHVEHLLYWLKKSGITYEVLTEYDLSAKKKPKLLEEIRDFLVVYSPEDKTKVVPFSQFSQYLAGGE